MFAQPPILDGPNPGPRADVAWPTASLRSLLFERQNEEEDEFGGARECSHRDVSCGPHRFARSLSSVDDIPMKNSADTR